VSTLLNAITNKESKVAAYDFTTLDAIPGMMEYDGEYKGARIQIIDLPGIIEGGASGKGRGREVFAAVISLSSFLTFEGLIILLKFLMNSGRQIFV
jgi:ribosome-interacting GTPase 1